MKAIDQHNDPATALRQQSRHSGMDSAVLDGIADRFPQHQSAVARMARLLVPTPPTVAVLGQYNHGKSSLLNALIGEDRFAVSDKRETVETQVQECNGIRWIDTPGLDADIALEDDRQANDAASHEADVRVLVHAIDLGELDRTEAAVAARLVAEQKATARAFLLVLTRIENASPDDRAAIVETIQQQVPEATVVPVSSHLWRRGCRENKPALAELGNLGALKQAITQAAETASAEREAELARLAADIQDSIAAQHEELEERLKALHDARQMKLAVLAPDLLLSLSNFNNDLVLE